MARAQPPGTAADRVARRMTAPPIRRVWQLLTDAIGGIGVLVLTPTLLGLLVYVGLFARSMLRQPTLPHLMGSLHDLFKIVR
jgi:hypothetical protein